MPESEGYEPPFAPFSHEDTERYEAFRVYANWVTSPAEKQHINNAVDAARHTLERMRFQKPVDQVAAMRRGELMRVFFVDE